MTESMTFRTHVSRTVKLAGPLAFAQFTTFFMGVVDVACVGRFSDLALGAVGIGNAVAWGISSIAFGISLALDPLISQAIGAGRSEVGHQWLRQGIRATFFVGTPLAGIAVAFTYTLPLVGIDDELAGAVQNYLVYRAPSIVLFQAFLCIKAFLQSHECTRPIMTTALWANAFNLVFNILFVFGDASLEAIGLPGMGIPAMGERGAGLTTSLSSLFLCVVLARHTLPFRKEMDPSAPDSTSLGKLLRLSWPISLQQVGESWLFCGFGILAGQFGSAAAGAHQVALTLAATAFMLALGLTSATSVRVGQAVGRGNHPDTQRAAAAGIVLVLMVMGTSASIFLLFPGELVQLLSNEEEIITLATPLLSTAAAFALFDGVQVVSSGALRGAGDIRIPSFLSFLTYWGVGGTVGWFAMNSPLQLQGIWLGLCAGLMAASVALGARLVWILRRPIVRI